MSFGISDRAKISHSSDCRVTSLSVTRADSLGKRCRSLGERITSVYMFYNGHYTFSKWPKNEIFCFTRIHGSVQCPQPVANIFVLAASCTMQQTQSFILGSVQFCEPVPAVSCTMQLTQSCILIKNVKEGEGRRGEYQRGEYRRGEDRRGFLQNLLPFFILCS